MCRILPEKCVEIESEGDPVCWEEGVMEDAESVGNMEIPAVMES